MPVRRAAMVLYRCCWIVFVALVVVTVPTGPLDPFASVFLPAAVALVTGSALSRSGGAGMTAPRPAVEVRPPVAGRRSAVHSPADKVPSRGARAYGQEHAVDILAEPEEGSRPPFRRLWPEASEFARGRAPVRWARVVTGAG
ncbi:hypothetical protein ACFYQ5_29075 [Streptomyces sp. NPDC005794]|uniref:hypothetical protein n=1 Tax=Streptomyces sp. NPDC005794 TaxID=3364733 RepID=UPI0036769F12